MSINKHVHNSIINIVHNGNPNDNVKKDITNKTNKLKPIKIEPRIFIKEN